MMLLHARDNNKMYAKLRLCFISTNFKINTEFCANNSRFSLVDPQLG